ncbi:MBOAT family O-acyltransferase [Aliinostoc sp. HNIBRCY26]|uniref:MBOAT family O-acyltransferase n=1 Tax=Aliinostoc sp. HNIBRCY26 TaxID=3418997 RepID=UPI003D00D92C
MELISIVYGLFILSVLGIYWALEKPQMRLMAILIGSIFAYSSLNTQYIPLLLALTFINFQFGREIGKNTSPGQHNLDWQISNEEWQFANVDWNQRRLKLLWLGVSLNVLILLAFKYINSAVAIFFDTPGSTSGNLFKVVAPLGISFFTFECIAYLVDVYRGAPASNQLLKFAAYKLFFPKLISGPITRYHNFITQFNSLEFPTTNRIAEALWLIARGAVKKGILADRLSIFVDLCFGNLQRAGSNDLWLATLAYGLHLYLDFSGYVDIARGSALLFGLVLPENFDFPYFSTSIAEFWRRWHMTLGDWLRNYVYFPLGGSRQGLTRTCWNLFIVMLIAGIWHGSIWTFVVWGVYHGLALVVHRLMDAMSDRYEKLEQFWQNPLGVVLAWFITQIMVFTSWIWFRLPNLQDSVWVFQHLWNHPADSQFYQKVYVEALNTSPHQIVWIMGILSAFMGVTYVFKRHLKLDISWPLKLVFVPLCFYAVWLFAPEGSVPFVYFNF